MAELTLTFALTNPWDRVQPLISGEVSPRDISLEYVQVPTGKLWETQLREQTYDVSEMSFSFTLQAIPLGWDYRVLPVFHNRTFSYVNTLVRLDSGIRPGHPEDLKGKRVGVVDYTMTGAVWARGVLHHEFGVTPQDVEWFQGRAFPSIPGQSEPLAPINGLVVNSPPNDINAMLAAGSLDAIYSIFPVREGTLADRARFSPLFPDGQAEAERYFTNTGIFPAHHATIVRHSLLQEHPWIAESLLEAFTEAQRLVMERSAEEPPTVLIFSRSQMEHQRSVFGDDPYKYGVKANAAVVDLVQTFGVEQGITPHKLPFKDFFAEGILDS
ncbi:MAG: 4,5-dihydroxyphthalate decarboxylase [Chloroflexi bacterium]|jgi:4,5-dihydroxyphthalate decarboxylase|nr:MAG: 4,5-dihydroxyphthalate decarboxylase [Chloroflexota bacterium]